MSTTQTPLPGPTAALIGLLALVLVLAQDLRSFADHFNAMAHEGAHAITGSVLGFQVRGIELERGARGGTTYRTSIVGLRGVVTAFIGYLGPSAFGLGAAKLIALGHIVTVLWLAAVALVVLLVKLAPRSFGFVSVPVAIALLYLILSHASLGLEVVIAYGITWLLLLSGVRVAIEHGANAGDAAILRDLTRLPRLLWALLWMAGTATAVYAGLRLLVMRS